jgi:hypothetical protein
MNNQEMMNDYMWSIYRIPEAIIEGSEYHQLITRFPTPTDFQGRAKVFVSSMDEPIESITVRLKYDEEGNAINTVAEIAAEIEAYLKDNNVRCVLLDRGLAGKLYKLLVVPQLLEE